MEIRCIMWDVCLRVESSPRWTKEEVMFERPYQKGDKVVYRKTKHSVCPGPRAQDILPAQFGDEYKYAVDKYWIVDQASDSKLLLRTRTGKTHEIDKNDPCLRHASWWERWVYKHRFPGEQPASTDAPQTSLQ